MTELKPCPFCGGKARITTNTGFGDLVVVECSVCGAKINVFDYAYKEPNVVKAIEAWNRRAE